MTGSDVTLRRMQPGEHCRITEEQWAQRLEAGDPAPFHQWGPCFLVDEGGVVWLWIRDTSSQARHTAACLDAERSARAREGIVEIEAASRHTADLVAAARVRGQSTLDQQREEMAASEHFMQLSDGLYRELMTFGPPRRESAGE
jgi:hypothetical protein